MRSVGDRLRHAVGFEIIGVLIVTPLAGWAFSAELHKVGVLALAMSLVATAWNYIYNVWFDRMMLRLRGRVRKRPGERVVHALAFELGMLFITLPPLMWWMGYDFERALAMDLSLMIFYLVYTYAYNWAYDLIFPVAEPNESTS